MSGITLTDRRPRACTYLFQRICAPSCAWAGLASTSQYGQIPLAAHILETSTPLFGRPRTKVRKVMSADVYKDYLGLVFYKALSDKMLVEAYDLLTDEKPESLEAAQEAYETAAADPDTWEELEAEMTAHGCAILPSTPSRRSTSRSTTAPSCSATCSRPSAKWRPRRATSTKDFFEDFDVDSKDLGKTVDKRNDMIASVIKALAHIDFNLSRRRRPWATPTST